MIWESRFKGEYISAAELGTRQPTFTIAKISVTKTEDEKKKREVEKAVMWFKEIDRALMYSKSVGHCMAAMFGKDDDAWIGKRITLYAEENVYFGSEQVGGIRIVGSPDIQKPITVRIKFPKKKPFEVKLVPTAPPKAAPKPSEASVPIT